MLPPTRPDQTILLGDLSSFRRDSFAFWLTTGRQAPLVRIRFGSLTRWVVNDPDIAKHILVTNRHNYIKEQRLKRILETGSGEVLATSDGAAWAWRRRLMQPAFQRQQVSDFMSSIASETERMFEKWSDSSTIDVIASMKTLTLNIIGRTMFSITPAEGRFALHHAYTSLGNALVQRVKQLLPIPFWVPTAKNRELRQALATISDALQATLKERRNSLRPHHDLLEMLLTARDEDNNRGFSESELIHEMSAIVFAGHETTAATLSWVLALLAKHSEVAMRVRTEVDSSLEGRTPTMADFRKMPYLRQVIDESMRYFPALYVNSRQAVRADRIKGYRIPAGARLLINILGIHRDEKHWPNSAQFDPERFRPEYAKDRHRFAFIPFLGGPRRCLGAPLAMAELQVILPMLLQRFVLKLVPGVKIVPEAAAVLQPRRLSMVLTTRKGGYGGS